MSGVVPGTDNPRGHPENEPCAGCPHARGWHSASGTCNYRGDGSYRCACPGFAASPALPDDFRSGESQPEGRADGRARCPRVGAHHPHGLQPVDEDGLPTGPGYLCDGKPPEPCQDAEMHEAHRYRSRDDGWQRERLCPGAAPVVAVPGEQDAVEYHPDPEINAEVIETVIEAERADLAAGFPPRMWRCPDCRAEHGRGHLMTIGQHRCLACGYVGTGGVMFGSNPGRPDTSRPERAEAYPTAPVVGDDFANAKSEREEKP